MEVNLFEVRDENELTGNWWFHISTKDFGFHTSLQNIATYELEENDILFLKEKNPEGFFTTYWFIATDMGVERTDLSEIQEVLSSSLIDFISVQKKLPYKCTAKLFANRKVRVYFKPTEYDKVVLYFEPGDHGIDDVYDHFEGLDTVETNPVSDERKVPKKQSSFARKKAPINKRFPSGERITVHSGTIKKIEEKERKYENKVFFVYILYLVDGVYELEGHDSVEYEELIAQISDSLHRKQDLQVGDNIYCKGRTKTDWNLGDIIHNIRTLKIQ